MPKPDSQSANHKGLRQPRRILAGLGGLADEAATIDAAVALARALRADIAGHFVEESNLLNLAGLPFAQAVRTPGRSATPIETGRMKQELAQAASTWRRTLVTRAERSRVTCTFQTSTGEYCSEIARATVESDFVVVNPANVARQGRARAQMLSETMGPVAGLVLLPQHWTAQKGPVVLLLGADIDQEAYGIAARIAEAAGTGLIIVAAPEDDVDKPQVRNRLAEQLGTDARIEFAPAGPVPDMADMVAALDPSFVVWPNWDAGADRENADTLLRAASAPLLLLKRAD